ncbi:MAG: sensor domain-containing diguanylate cyclase [Proteobacteria bacterium]|nr:sensor domain-containing diguanylate cyclase [Pseudomonadota bacterium]
MRSSVYKRKILTLKALSEIGKLLTSTLELDKVLKLVLEKVGGILSAKNWSLLLVDELTQELYFEIVVGDFSDKIKGKRLKAGEGIAGWVFTHKKPLLVTDAEKDERFSPFIDNVTGFKTKSVICCPLICRNNVLGVIELINKKIGKEFTEDDLEILIYLSDYIAIAIDNARNFSKIQELTVKDDLTCLYNTRFFHEMLDREIKRAFRKNRELSLIFIDMDHFKEVNDTYGHLYGSQLLKEVAEVIKNTIRSIDIPIRYGGDEFVIILPETTKEQAGLVAERILNNIRNKDFLSNVGLSLKLTASIGYANFPEDAKNKEELVVKADNAMYKVKNTSRNDFVAA